MDNENEKWEKVIKVAIRHVSESTDYIFVFDRGGDAYPVLSQLTERDAGVVVRANQNRFLMCSVRRNHVKGGQNSIVFILTGPFRSSYTETHTMKQFRRSIERALIGVIVFVGLVLSGSGVSAQQGKNETTEPLHIHMIGASTHYSAQENLPILKSKLVASYDVTVTMTKSPGEAGNLDGLEHLADADLLVLFARRLELNEASWKPIRTYIDSGRPIVGIRTASHAFDKNFPKFDRTVLGADYEGHKGDKPVQVNVVEENRNHPILEGISSWKREWGDLYDNVDFDESTTVLLKGDDGRRVMPVAWTNEKDGRRVFYTSMGIPEDFRQDKYFLRLVTNGINWCLKGGLEAREIERGKGTRQ